MEGRKERRWKEGRKKEGRERDGIRGREGGRKRGSGL